MMKRLTVAIATLGILTGCGATKFGSAKDVAQLKAASVFGDNSTGSIKQPGSPEDTSSGSINQQGGGGLPSFGQLLQLGSNGAGGQVSQPSVNPPSSGRVRQPAAENSGGQVKQPTEDTSPGWIPQVPANAPSWAHGTVPTPITSQPADPASGLLPPITPRLVCGPAHGNNDKGPTLMSAQQGVKAALYKCDQPGAPSGCNLVESLSNAGGATDLANRILHGQTFQPKSSKPLSAGNYYLVLYPSGTTPLSKIGWTDGATAIAPFQDSLTDHLNTVATFKVDSAGKASVTDKQWNVLVDVEDSEICDDKNADTIDPLMIDFSGHGIRLSSQEKGINFDLIGDGSMLRVSWPMYFGNMFLLRDLYKPGKVTGDNMFGNYTVLSNGQLAADGFEALSDYDLNSDYIIDMNDVIYANLRLWSDWNRDGSAQKSELFSLQQMGVQSIELTTYPVNEADIYGNVTTVRAIVHMNDGSMKVISDVWFKPAR